MWLSGRQMGVLSSVSAPTLSKTVRISSSFRLGKANRQFTLTGGANRPIPLPLRETLKGERGTRNLAATPDEPHARLSRPDRPPELHAPKPPGSDLTAGMGDDRVIVPSLLAPWAPISS